MIKGSIEYLKERKHSCY